MSSDDPFERANRERWLHHNLRSHLRWDSQSHQLAQAAHDELNAAIRAEERIAAVLKEYTAATGRAISSVHVLHYGDGMYQVEVVLEG